LGDTFLVDIERILDSRRAVVEDCHSLTPAAVLLALYPSGGDFHVVMQKRSERVEHHKGEISFPGGTVDPEDESLLATALREASEEMGIAPEDVRPLGRLDDTPTTTGFMISTFVGALPHPYEFTPSDAEVAEALFVPLSRLRDPASRRVETRLENGAARSLPVYVYDGSVIFGATARILEQFLASVSKVPSPLCGRG